MRIHFISDSPKSNSGFANVTKNLAKGLSSLGHIVSISGFQTPFKEYYYEIPVFPMATGLDEITQLNENLIKTDPNVVIYINDGYTDARKFLNVFPRMITYTPVEGFDIPNHMITNLNRVAENGLVIAQCKYGYNEMKRAGIKVHSFIYHGFDPKSFYPIKDNKFDYCYCETEVGRDSVNPIGPIKLGCQNNCDNKECIIRIVENVSLIKYDNKEKQFLQIEDLPISKLKENVNPSKKFMFLFVGANHMIRKKIERLLGAYAILIEESKQLKARVHLHLHTNPISPTGIDLLEIANRLKIQDNISFSYGNWSEKALNILYNISDCHVSATSSEGFGLAHLESMAVGLPQIAPNCTSITELIGETVEDPSSENRTIGPRGLLAKIQADYMLQDLTYRSLVDEIDLAHKMKQAYNNKELREQYSKNAIKFADQYNWNNVCYQWNTLLKEMK